jgi:hypothetical protein
VQGGEVLLYDGATVQTQDGRETFSCHAFERAIEAGLFCRCPILDPGDAPKRVYGKSLVRAGELQDEELLHESYQNCLWDLRTGSGELLRASLSRASGDGTARAYDIVSTDLHPPGRVYGVNGIFSRLRSSYWGAHEKAVTGEGRWVRRDEFLDTLWRHAFGSRLTPDPWTDEHRGCFWFPANRKRFYSMPSPGRLVVDLRGGSKGRFARGSRGTLRASRNSWSSDPAATLSFGSVDLRGVPVSFCDVSELNSLCKAAIRTGHSVVAAFPLTNREGERALYLKPIGVDQLYFGRLGEHRRIEAFTEVEGGHKLRRLVAEVGRRSFGPVASDQFAELCYAGPVRFAIRNMETGQVSAPAEMELHWVKNKRYRPLAAEVRRRGPGPEPRP